MLTYRPLKNHAGILLAGDYQTLRSLHDVIHAVNDRSPIIKDKEGAFLGLAYDLRKAYEGQRQKLGSPEEYPEIGPCFGVEILWPVILWQSRVLRASMGFIDTTKGMQAHAYALEAIIEEALNEDFGRELGAKVAIEWERFDPRHPGTEATLMSRGGVFCSWTKAQRKTGLVSMIGSLDSMYAVLYPIWLRNGVKGLVSPEEYDVWTDAEWPDPRW